MTVSELLSLDADSLEKMTDKELETIFAPYLDVSRPDRVIKQERLQKQIPHKNAAAIKKLAEAGIDISQFL